MSEVREWLEAIGLVQYADAFEANDIDIDLLGQVDDQTLKDIGVSSAGHRLRIRNAIAKLSPASPLAKNENTTSAATEPKTQDTAERRQVTVMFSDLVGSTALSARMDPEDLREVISAYQNCVAETVRALRRFRGEVHGRRRPRLLRLSASARGRRRASGPGRTGVDPSGGRVEVQCATANPRRHCHRVGRGRRSDRIGRVSGASDRRRDAEPRGAAARRRRAEHGRHRREHAKAPRQSLRSARPRRTRPQGRRRPGAGLGGAAASSVESRFEALHATGLTALVGREEELELLLRRWSRAKTGDGQVVLLSGEAGIGKSRLTAALLERLAAEPHTRLRYFCSPQHTDSALYPIIGQMERAAGFAHGDTAQAKLDKLDALLAQTSTSKQDAALFAEMLSLPNDGRYPALELEPQQRRQKTLEALTAQVEALSRQNPLLMIFEDAHWTDPTSLETFGRIVDRVRSLPVLLIVTFRPEFEPPWIGRPYVTALTINRLAQRDIEAMIDGVVGNKLIPANVRQDIIERTDGIPLFVEEMTKAVLEAGSEEEAQRTAATVPSTALAVPASLHASLMARLDRLGPAKEVAQTGAAIGREFSHALLAAVVRKPEAELKSALDRLVAPVCCSGRVYRRHASYLFKHALVQDAAYGTLLREPRRDASRSHRRNIRKPVRRDRRKPARAAGASLYRSWADREGGGPVGQGGTTVAGALGACRSDRAAHPRSGPDHDLARHARAATRTDQTSGRAHNTAHPCQRLCGAGN